MCLLMYYLKRSAIFTETSMSSGLSDRYVDSELIELLLNQDLNCRANAFDSNHHGVFHYLPRSQCEGHVFWDARVAGDVWRTKTHLRFVF